MPGKISFRNLTLLYILLFFLFVPAQALPQLNDMLVPGPEAFLPHQQGSFFSEREADVLNGLLSSRQLPFFKQEVSAHKALQDNGFLLSETVYQIWLDGKWTNTRSGQNYYDKYNDAVQYIHRNWNGSEWVNSTRNLSAFDPLHHLLVVTGQNWTGDGWQDAVRVVNMYDTHYNRVGWKQLHRENNEWMNDIRLTFTYSNIDNLIEYVHQ